jgi:hypothetical protein
MKTIQPAVQATRTPMCSFYCRWKNRVVHSCGREGGPGGCPLRRECPADTMMSPLPAAPRLLSS